MRPKWFYLVFFCGGGFLFSFFFFHQFVCELSLTLIYFLLNHRRWEREEGEQGNESLLAKLNLAFYPAGRKPPCIWPLVFLKCFKVKFEGCGHPGFRIRFKLGGKSRGLWFRGGLRGQKKAGRDNPSPLHYRLWYSEWHRHIQKNVSCGVIEDLGRLPLIFLSQ